MATTKEYSIRERVLDKYLHSGKGYTRKELQAFVNKELERRGYPPVTARITILNDLREISNKYNVVIDNVKKGRFVYYSYHDPDFSIYNTGLSDEDFDQITEAIEVLKRYQGIPKISWVDELAARLETSIHNQTRPIIMFEDASYNQGMEFFVELYEFISQKRTINLEYQDFKHTEPKAFVVYPYLLKQYNNRWFLFGRRKGHFKHTIFTLDRIVSITPSDEPFEDTTVDLTKYFDDKVGVSEMKGEHEAYDVVFRVPEKQKPYILTKPLHKSQKFISDDGEYAVFSLHVQDNFELQGELLALGELVEVLSPQSLRDEIRSRWEKCMAYYEK